jgi:hypothetical protein
MAAAVIATEKMLNAIAGQAEPKGGQRAARSGRATRKTAATRKA